jgi:hypothetical protein
VYRCGTLVDLCRGPHVIDTGRIKAFAVQKNSSSYWLGDAANESLQRIYGVSFPSSKEMTEYKKFLEEAAKRDHRRIGRVRLLLKPVLISVRAGSRALLFPRIESGQLFLFAARHATLQYARLLHQGTSVGHEHQLTH